METILERVPVAARAWLHPNYLTMVRLVAVPFVWVLLVWVGPWPAFLCYTFAALLDYFDGVAARVWGMTSDWGKRYDALADKVLVFGTAVALYVQAWWGDGASVALWLALPALLVVALRDGAVTMLRIRNPDRAKDVPSLPDAKRKTVFLMLAVGLLLVGFVPLPDGWHAADLGVAFAWLGAVFALTSGLDYLRHFRAL